ncbi:metallophosphoesterase [Salmonirosea aquatica]|uniref:Metallophosphoesterase n=1 Tax=Salmonirosea aquatica TaxID=2654236 RepID=A0A7C9FPV3_9BACT|nr:metallophosphoesterase [Cytophagaceae bacterium SJW1-29]
MQIIAIGDVHGRGTWKKIKDCEADHIIFIGDYLDPHRPIPDYEVLRNFEEIIAFKKSSPETITLLLGNHDTQYLHYPLYSCSGHRADLQETLGKLFLDHIDLFAIAWQRGRYLLTHAGVSQGWYDRHLDTLKKFEGNSLAETLNTIHESEYRDILFEVGRSRGGWHPYGGPIWADQSETKHNYLANFHQVVGHSRVSDFEKYGDENASITYIDVGDTRVRFFEKRLE